MEPETFVDDGLPEEWEQEDMEEALPATEASAGVTPEVAQAADELWESARRWASQPTGWRFLTLTLTADEHVALNKLAVSEEREKYEMAEIIVRRELRRRGLLKQS